MRKGEQTRREIIRKAAPIFNQKGFEGAALSDLMQATGLEKGGIYRHFDSKEQLAAEAFDYAWSTAVGLRLEGTQEIANTVAFGIVLIGIGDFRAIVTGITNSIVVAVGISRETLDSLKGKAFAVLEIAPGDLLLCRVNR